MATNVLAKRRLLELTRGSKCAEAQTDTPAQRLAFVV